MPAGQVRRRSRHAHRHSLSLFNERSPAAPVNFVQKRLVTRSPVAQRRHGSVQRLPIRRQPIPRFGGYDRVHGTLDEAAALQRSQDLDQHLLRNVRDVALNLAEPFYRVRQAVENDRRPLIADEFQQSPRRVFRPLCF